MKLLVPEDKTSISLSQQMNVHLKVQNLEPDFVPPDILNSYADNQLFFFSVLFLFFK